MSTINAAIFDPETGQVLSTMAGSADLLENHPSWVVIPEGISIKNPKAWTVDLVTGNLILTDITALVVDTRKELNDLVGSARLRFITDIPGQQLVYSIKEQQAKAFLAADPEPTDLTEYRFISSEVTARGITAYEAAQLILNLSAQWQYVGGILEDIRLKAMIALDAATTEQEIETIKVGVEANIQNLLVSI